MSLSFCCISCIFVLLLVFDGRVGRGVFTALFSLSVVAPGADVLLVSTSLFAKGAGVLDASSCVGLSASRNAALGAGVLLSTLLWLKKWFPWQDSCGSLRS